MLEVVVRDDRADSSPPIDLERWRALAADALRATVDRLAPAVADAGPSELAVSFVDAAAITVLNREHLGGDGPTDVLSFPIDQWSDAVEPDDIRMWGDIVICPDVVAANAAAHTGDLDDEYALMIVHGVLHIAGFDHQSVEEAGEMHAVERELLTRFHGEVTVPEHQQLIDGELL